MNGLGAGPEHPACCPRLHSSAARTSASPPCSNALTRTRDALVTDLPGLTRDRRYGYVRIQGRDAVAVDTGGLVNDGDTISRLISDQAALAIEESDAVVLVLDARAGLTGADQRIADRLRRSGKPILIAANKIDGLDETVAAAEFHALGLGEPIPIAAVHRRGIGRITAALAGMLPQDEAQPASRRDDGIRVCIIGRPNTGKSTLVNRLVGDTRVLAHDMPGTTRDSVEVPFEQDGRRYVLIDTAGIRRRSRVSEKVEKFSIVKALDANRELRRRNRPARRRHRAGRPGCLSAWARPRRRAGSGHRDQQMGPAGR